jgi:hypothetical protein
MTIRLKDVVVAGRNYGAASPFTASNVWKDLEYVHFTIDGRRTPERIKIRMVDDECVASIPFRNPVIVHGKPKNMNDAAIVDDFYAKQYDPTFDPQWQWMYRNHDGKLYVYGGNAS